MLPKLSSATTHLTPEHPLYSATLTSTSSPSQDEDPGNSCINIGLLVASRIDPLRLLQAPLPNSRYGKSNSTSCGYHAEMSHSLAIDVGVELLMQ